MRWRTVKLSSACEIEKKIFRGSKLTYVGMEDIEGHTGKFLGSLEAKSAGSATFHFNADHVLYGRLRPYLNKVLVPDFEGHCSSEIFPLKPSEAIDRKFLYYWLSSANTVAAANATCTGTRMPRANVKEVLSFEFPLPSVEEQKRIVAILDQAFADIDKARALTEQNLKNARELFNSSLASVFVQHNSTPSSAEPLPDVNQRSAGKNYLPVEEPATSTKTGGRAATDRVIEGSRSLSVGKPGIVPKSNWRWSKLSDLARLESGHTPSRKHPEYWGGEIPWIGIKDARTSHGTTIKRTLQCTNQLGIDNSSARVLPAGTVCLSRTASVGYVTVMGVDMATSQDFVNWVCSDQLAPNFLKYLLLAENRNFSAFSSGSVHQTIYFPEVKAFHVCHPARQEQERLVTHLDQIAKYSELLAAKHEKKLAFLAELKNSLLQKAFSGELTQGFAQEAAEAAA